MKKKKKKHNGYWYDLERCKLEAQKFKNKTDWYKKSGSSYNVALKMGWIDECTPHMKQSKTGKKTVICVETNTVYDSINKASKAMNIGSSHISLVLRNKVKSAHGYTFKYVSKSKKTNKE